jgi:hypothetical protein
MPPLKEVKLLVHVSSVDCQATWLRIVPPGSRIKEPINNSIHMGSRISPTAQFHVTAEEAYQSQDVVLGMFLANLHPSIILFESGSLHSFITSKVVVKHNLSITILKYTMIVSSPRGEMKTKHLCLAVSIAIRGVDFL